MLQLWFACVDIYNTDTTAINKLYKLNLRYFTMYLVICQQQCYQGLFSFEYSVLLRV